MERGSVSCCLQAEKVAYCVMVPARVITQLNTLCSFSLLLHLSFFHSPYSSFSITSPQLQSWFILLP
jgi:hypothetical protein